MVLMYSKYEVFSNEACNLGHTCGLSFFLFLPIQHKLKKRGCTQNIEKIFFDRTDKIAQQMPKAEVGWQPSTLCESENG